MADVTFSKIETVMLTILQHVIQRALLYVAVMCIVVSMQRDYLLYKWLSFAYIRAMQHVLINMTLCVIFMHACTK